MEIHRANQHFVKQICHGIFQGNLLSGEVVLLHFHDFKHHGEVEKISPKLCSGGYLRW